MDVVIRQTPKEVAQLAAAIMARYVSEGKNIGLATGSTPLLTYQELITKHREGLSFANTTAFLLDEYVGLPEDHEQSYHYTIYNEFTQYVDFADGAVHTPDGMNPRTEEAGREYEAAIEAAGGIDIQLLGVGTNGHVGFNEPGSSFESLTRLKTLHPQTRRDNARFFGSLEDVPIHVITQGLGTIRRAGHLLLLATGENKADAVARLVEGPVSAMMPASVLQLHRHATVIVDEAAASQLQETEFYRFVDANRPEWQAY